MNRKIGSGKNPKVSFRYKKYGWREIYLFVGTANRGAVSHQEDDLFFRFFENGHCYMPSCYECPFRNYSVADIRIGDYWGDRFKYDRYGVSMLVSFTERGNNAVKKLKTTGVLQEQDITEYMQCQQIENNAIPTFYYALMNELKNEESALEDIYEKYCKPFDEAKGVQCCIY